MSWDWDGKSPLEMVIMLVLVAMMVLELKPVNSWHCFCLIKAHSPIFEQEFYRQKAGHLTIIQR